MSNATTCLTCRSYGSLPGFHADGSDAPDFECPDCAAPPACEACETLAATTTDACGTKLCEVCAEEAELASALDAVYQAVQLAPYVVKAGHRELAARAS